jgi:serine/threonine protein kinase
VNNRVVIDPLQLTPETSQILSAYLVRKKKNGLLIPWNTPVAYGFRKNFKLTCGIIAREKSAGNWHFDILTPEKKGQGKFGSIHEVLAVMKLTGDAQQPLSVIRKNKRVYKIQDNAAWAEFALMQLCPHMAVRGLFGGAPSYISMRKFPGYSLNVLLNKERKEGNLTLAQRFQLPINLLKAVMLLHEKRICHRDIKPDNILYDEETGEIYIIDLGISKHENDHSDLRSRGNAVFTAPEEFTCARTMRPVTQDEYDAFVGMISDTNLHSDIWSIARVIGLIWHDLDPLFSDKSDFRGMIKKRIQSGWRANFHLFSGVSGLTKDERMSIKKQLESMTQLNRDDRPDIEACIAFFETIYQDFQKRMQMDTVVNQGEHSNLETTFSI